MPLGQDNGCLGIHVCLLNDGLGMDNSRSLALVVRRLLASRPSNRDAVFHGPCPLDWW